MSWDLLFTTCRLILFISPRLVLLMLKNGGNPLLQRKQRKNYPNKNMTKQQVRLKSTGVNQMNISILCRFYNGLKNGSRSMCSWEICVESSNCGPVQEISITPITAPYQHLHFKSCSFLWLSFTNSISRTFLNHCILLSCCVPSSTSSQIGIKKSAYGRAIASELRTPIISLRQAGPAIAVILDSRRLSSYKIPSWKTSTWEGLWKTEPMLSWRGSSHKSSLFSPAPPFHLMSSSN